MMCPLGVANEMSAPPASGWDGLGTREGLDRLTESSGGQLLYVLPHPRRDGATHLVLDPLELIAKLSVLIPAPRFHLLRSHGLLAPHAAGRAQVVLRRPQAVDQGAGAVQIGRLKDSNLGPAD
jgi:hypothetical protein